MGKVRKAIGLLLSGEIVVLSRKIYNDMAAKMTNLPPSFQGILANECLYKLSSVPTLVEQKELVIGSEVIFTHRDLCK